MFFLASFWSTGPNAYYEIAMAARAQCHFVSDLGPPTPMLSQVLFEIAMAARAQCVTLYQILLNGGQQNARILLSPPSVSPPTIKQNLVVSPMSPYTETAQSHIVLRLRMKL